MLLMDGEPFVDKGLISYLNKIFHTDNLLSYKACNNDERIGYIKGVSDVINTLNVLASRKDGEDDGHQCYQRIGHQYYGFIIAADITRIES